MTILENRIKKNKEIFDVHEPQEGHLDRFASKLKDLDEGQERTFYSRFRPLIRIAAIFIVLLAVSGLALLIVPKSQNGAYAAELPKELQEVKLHYEFETKEKLDRLDQCAIDPEQSDMIRNIAREEMEKIDKKNEQLLKEYQKNPGNEKVEQAMIKNFKSKSEILDNIIRRICEL